MIRASGGVLWRLVPDASVPRQIEVAVIHRPRYDDWSFPKGKLAPRETDVEGAIREVLEETGHRVRLGRPLGEVRYMKRAAGIARPKVVRYWSMQSDGGIFSPSREVDELRWMSLDKAGEMLTHDHDRDILDRFVHGPTLSGTILLVRHASAGSRSKWQGDDRRRSLDELGWAQAQELVRVLSRFEVQAIISADFLRCLQTVQPLSEAIGVPIEEDAVFSELGYPAHEEDAKHLLRKLGESLSTTVVCSQGDVIPDLLERVATEDQVDMPENQVKKGGFVALTFDGPRLFSAEYFPPPI